MSGPPMEYDPRRLFPFGLSPIPEVPSELASEVSSMYSYNPDDDESEADTTEIEGTKTPGSIMYSGSCSSVKSNGTLEDKGNEVESFSEDSGREDESEDDDDTDDFEEDDDRVIIEAPMSVKESYTGLTKTVSAENHQDISTIETESKKELTTFEKSLSSQQQETSCITCESTNISEKIQHDNEEEEDDEEDEDEEDGGVGGDEEEEYDNISEKLRRFSDLQQKKNDGETEKKLTVATNDHIL